MNLSDYKLVEVDKMLEEVNLAITKQFPQTQAQSTKIILEECLIPKGKLHEECVYARKRIMAIECMVQLKDNVGATVTRILDEPNTDVIVEDIIGELQQTVWMMEGGNSDDTLDLSKEVFEFIRTCSIGKYANLNKADGLDDTVDMVVQGRGFNQEQKWNIMGNFVRNYNALASKLFTVYQKDGTYSELSGMFLADNIEVSNAE
jgi:hypothetical protein